MKKTSRRRFAKQLTGALAALPMATLATPIVSAQEKTQTKAKQNVVRFPFGNLEIFNQHDTPPPVLFMSGSCIFEIQFIEGRSVPPKITFKEFLAMPRKTKSSEALSAVEQAHVGHVKIVDGSGEMLYRFDNNNKESIVIALALRQNNQPLGDFSLGIVNGELELSYPATTKVEHLLGDDSVNKRRLRLRCLDSASSADNIDISAIRVQKDSDAGMIPMYACVLRDLKLGGPEVRVMLWFEIS